MVKVGYGCPDIDEKKYPLTYKWWQKVRNFAYNYDLPVLECLQEAYLLEWKLKSKKFENNFHRSSYFRKSLDRKLHFLATDKYRLTGIKGRKFSRDLMKTPWEARNELESLMTQSGEDLTYRIDSVIQLPPFFRVFENDLTINTAILLANVNHLAAQIFIDKMKLQISWKELRLKMYKNVSHGRYYKAVKMIKAAVKYEVANEPTYCKRLG